MMRVKIKKRKGRFKSFEVEVDLDLYDVSSDDIQDLYHNLVKIFKEWDKK